MNGDLLKRFSAAVLALGECAEPADFGPTLLRAMQTLFAAHGHVVNWIGPTKFEDVSVRSEEWPREASLEVFNAHLHEHPLQPILVRMWKDERPCAGRWSDFVALREFQQTALYQDFFRHTATKYQLATTIRVDAHAVLGLSVNRDRTDFRPEDVAVLEQFATHVQQLVRTMQGRVEVQNALALRELAASREAVMIVDDEDAVHFATESAQRLVRDYFPGSAVGKLPEILRVWLVGHPRSGERLAQVGKSGELLIECAAEVPALVKICESLPIVSGRASGLRLLRFTERHGVSSAVALQRLGLTPRQAEVLYWMAQGKRNDEIAIILGTRPRTVDKHCENLFSKLGLETRTAAAAAAWEILAG